jgi:hypothetical protein
MEGEISEMRSLNKQLGKSVSWIVDALLQDEDGVKDIEQLKSIQSKKREALESLAYVRDVLNGGITEVEEERLWGEREFERRRPGHGIALAGFVDDDHVETRDAGVEILDYPGVRHDPDGNCAAALGHFSGGFGSQERNTNAVTFADAAYGVQPAHHCLPLARGGTASLSRPRALVNERYGNAAKLFTQFFIFRLEGFE